MILRFVHLSDIHFGHEKDGTLVKQDHIRDALIKDIEQLAQKRGPTTRVLITGDIAYSRQPAEYATAAQWLEKLTVAAGCDETQVRTIPGNDDCLLIPLCQSGYDDRFSNHQRRMATADQTASTSPNGHAP